MTARIITITEDWAITDGPSREDLFDALRLFKEHRCVEFELLERRQDGQLRINGSKVRLKARILGISPEDGSGHSWCLDVQFENNENITLTNKNTISVYYHDAGNGGRGGRRGGQVSDARPDEVKIRVDRDGTVYRGAFRIGHVDGLSNR